MDNTKINQVSPIDEYEDDEKSAPRVKRAQPSVIKFGNDSIWARIAYSQQFEICTMCVISFNAIWIGIDTEWNHENLKDADGKAPLEPGATVIENFFCVYFTIELACRFLAYREKTMCFFDAWFVFDSVLVACMIFETWIMPLVELIMDSDKGGGVGPLSALRLLRLLRLARVGRLMRFVPELKQLVKGMIKAARSVIWVLLFLILIIYVFSIIFTGSFSDREEFPLTPRCSEEILNREGGRGEEECLEPGEWAADTDWLVAQDLFGSIGDSFMTLFTQGVLGDNLDQVVDAILAEGGTLLMWVFWIFFLMTFTTLLNMLIGVVCDVISDAASEEEEAQTVSSLTNTIQEAFDQIDENHDGLVSQVEWSHIKSNQNVRKTLMSLGIETERMEERLEQMQEMLFHEGETPTLDEDGEPVKVEVELKKSDTGVRTGLKVDELIQKVVEIRPDEDACALSFELMKAQVMKDHRLFKNCLRKTEAQVKLLPGAYAASRPGSRAGSRAGTPAVPVKPAKLEGPLLLDNIPSALLFQALKQRTEIEAKKERA